MKADTRRGKTTNPSEGPPSSAHDRPCVPRVLRRHRGPSEDLYLKTPLPNLSESENVSDRKTVSERVPPVLDWLERCEYANRNHVIFLLLWQTGARIGGIRAFNVRDCEVDSRRLGLDFVHRTETGTPLKNDEQGERYNRITEETARIVQDWINGPRPDVTDDTAATRSPRRIGTSQSKLCPRYGVPVDAAVPPRRGVSARS